MGGDMKNASNNKKYLAEITGARQGRKPMAQAKT